MLKKSDRFWDRIRGERKGADTLGNSRSFILDKVAFLNIGNRQRIVRRQTGWAEAGSTVTKSIECAFCGRAGYPVRALWLLVAASVLLRPSLLAGRQATAVQPFNSSDAGW